MDPFKILVSICYIVLTSATTITRAPELRPRQSASNSGSLSCDSYSSLVAACAFSTPGFLSLGPGVQYSCLCFSSSSWAPSTVQGYIQGCLPYLETASPAYYSSIGGDSFPTDYCTAASDLLATAVSTSVSSSPTAALTAPLASYSAACVSLQGLVSSCAGRTSLFTSLPFSSQAACLCTASSSNYLYDQLWQSCLDYEQIANPTEWSSLGGTYALTTPCAAAAGNLGSATALSTAAATTAKVSSSFSQHSSSAALTSAASSSAASGAPASSSAASISSATPNSSAGSYDVLGRSCMYMVVVQIVAIVLYVAF